MARKNSPNHGSLNCIGKSKRYYYRVKLPGTNKRKPYPLRSPGHKSATRDRRLAIMLANDMWDRAAEAISGGGQATLLSKMTLKDYTDKYVKMKEGVLATRTLKGYKISIQYALEFFGPDCIIDTITPLQVQDFKTALATGSLKNAVKTKKGPNRTSVNIHTRQLGSILNFAVTKLEILSKNPFSGAAEKVKQSKRWHYITPDELRDCLEAATENYRCLIALCRLAALRRLEAFYLTWQDVNFDKGKIIVVGDARWQPKDRETRVVPICPELQVILLGAFEQAPEKTSRICPLKYSGNICRGAKATIIRAGLKPWEKPLHDLRKSCITDWANHYPIHAVKEWAGHVDIATTQKYYLQVPPVIYEQAASCSLWSKPAEPVNT